MESFKIFSYISLLVFYAFVLMRYPYVHGYATDNGAKKNDVEIPEDEYDNKRWMGHDLHDIEDCNQQNKAKSLYGHPVYNPSLSHNPITQAYTTVKGMLVEPLRTHGSNGIYEATQIHTTQYNGEKGCGGYFGVQWEGKHSKPDQIIFSIWDKEKGNDVLSYALPNHSNCKRNCNDCSGALDETTGTQCKMHLPEKLQEKDELELQIEREAVERLPYDGLEHTGHVWTLKIRYASGPNKHSFMENQFGVNKDEEFILGRILFADDDLDIGIESSGGIIDFDMFHEHIGCTPCGTFAFETERSGPYITRSAENREPPKLEEGSGSFSCPWNEYSCTCLLFDVKSYDFGNFSFLTGPGSTPHWDDIEKNTKMYWSDGEDTYALNESECVDVKPTIDCVEAEVVGNCNNVDWATTNCAKTCDLCCALC